MKPLNRERYYFFERSAFFKKMRLPANNLEFFVSHFKYLSSKLFFLTAASDVNQHEIETLAVISVPVTHTKI